MCPPLFNSSEEIYGAHSSAPYSYAPEKIGDKVPSRIFEDSREILENSRISRVRMRAINFRESFEGNSRKFPKFENENEGNIFESFGIPTRCFCARAF